MNDINRQIVLKSRPSGWVDAANFETTESPIPDPKAGQMLVRNIYLSVDPYMRGRMNEGPSYIPAFEVGAVLQGGAVGQVVASENPNFQTGDYVTGMLGWENYSLSDGTEMRKIQPMAGVPLSWHLGILGMPGMTAYVGLVGVAEAKARETVFVSAAAGAVGSVVGQLARILGCKVVGSAGSDEKVRLLTEELGFDSAFNYKTAGNLTKAVAEHCPDGIDVNFENVGGDILEAVLFNMRNNGRMALCGMISNYNDKEMAPGPRGMFLIIGRSLRLQGFIVFNYPQLCEEYVSRAVGWVKEGKLQYRETVAEGIENAPGAFINMLKGGNLGKQIVRLSDDT